MDKKSKVLLYALLILTLLSAGFAYYQMIIKRSFPVVDSTETPIESEVASSTY